MRKEKRIEQSNSIYFRNTIRDSLYGGVFIVQIQNQWDVNNKRIYSRRRALFILRVRREYRKGKKTLDSALKG